MSQLYGLAFNRKELLFVLFFCLAGVPILHGQQSQLRQLKIETAQPRGPIAVFTEYPDQAVIVIRSSLTNLTFESTLVITAQLGDPATGDYVLIVPPQRQSIMISAPGFINEMHSTGTLNARDVRHITVEPVDRSITDTGTLILRSEPMGAAIHIEGIPGNYTTPHTFD
jgi:hypothetical protein